MQTKTVVVTGSNGYIGREVCIAFRQLGYIVYGMCRSLEKFKAARLFQEEIIPAIVDYSKPETIKPFVEKAGIVVECATMTPTKEIIEMMLNLTQESGKCEDGSLKLFIQTTGFMQYQFEEYVLLQQNVLTTVVRPSFIYGKTGGMVFDNLLFKKPEQGEKLNIGGNKDKIWPWCHISDLASLYTNIAQQKASLQKGQIFRGGILNKEITYEKILLEVAKCMGVDVKYEAPKEGIESILAEIHTDSFDNESAVKIGWKPKHSCNPIEQMKVHYDSYLAWKQ